jgi:putative DNA primase/helicase
VVRRAGYDPDENSVEDLTNGDIALALDRIIHDNERQHYRVVRDATEAIYAYDDGVWTDEGEIMVKELMRQATPNKNTRQLWREVCHQLRSDYRMKIDRDTLGAPAGTIATQDGLVDLLDGHVRELEPKDYALNQIESGYSPEADCPTFKKFVQDSCSVDEIEKIQEYAGYLLWQHAQPIGKACFLVGPTDSGKGTFIKAMKTVLGKENVSAQSLDDLVSTRWGPAHMFGKIANMRNEVKPDGVANIEMFKEITGGGDEITAEFKGEQKFEYTVTQKQLFSTNQFPVPDHADEAFWNRCLFVEFPETVPDDEKNLSLLAEIREEREGVFNWMLDGLKRLMEQGQFSDERGIKEKQEIAASYGSPTQRFKFNALSITGNQKDVVDRAHLHDVYVAFCKRELDRAEDDILGQGALTKRLKKDDRINKTRSRSLSSGKERDEAMNGIQIKKAVLEHLNMEDEVNQNSAAEDKGSGQTGFSR